MMKTSEIVVISVGGSIMVPNDINEKFIKRFKEVIEHQVELGRKFVIIAGGGRTSRHYQNVAKEFRNLSPTDIDWIGINATWLNANFLRIIFDEIASPEIITNPTKDVYLRKPVTIAGGWKPGSSTDYIAVLIAKKLGAQKMINLGDVDFVYDVPAMQESNKLEAITDISWTDFRKMLPEHWDPGQHTPFDPVASEEAEKIGLEVAVINGQILEEFERYLDGEDFRGTLIHK